LRRLAVREPQGGARRGKQVHYRRAPGECGERGLVGIGLEGDSCRRTVASARGLRLLGDVRQLVGDHVLAVIAAGLERTALEVDVASARERLLPGGHLRAVRVDLDVAEALAVRLLHACERRGRKLPITRLALAIDLALRRGPRCKIHVELPTCNSALRHVQGPCLI
jgi:hypothetical protein